MKEFIPPYYSKRRYYIKADLEKHNKANDCWISLFNRVYDLTNLV